MSTEYRKKELAYFLNYDRAFGFLRSLWKDEIVKLAEEYRNKQKQTKTKQGDVGV